jgi:asparagine synthase (glutamine-hydrolysing)
VIAGVIARGGDLRLEWEEPAQVREADELTVALDGFLLGPLADLEEVAAEWRRSGAAMADRLRGAFTLVVWDGRVRTGMIACDQFSLRPCLVHGLEAAELRFSTHMTTLRRMLPGDPRADAGVIAPWIAPQYLQGHRTMLAGVERVGGGRLLELGGDGWRRHRYWRPEWRDTLDASPDELVELLRAELRRAIGERVPPGEPAGTILSGGVDSSVVLATAAGLEPPRPLRAYSTVFPEWRAADESERIVATTTALGVPGTRFALRPQGALRLALEQLRDSGTVPGGPGAIVERPGVARAAADGVRVLLDGQGGDEVFGRSPYLLADCVRRANVTGAARLLRLLVPERGKRLAKVVPAARLLREFGIRPAVGRPSHAQLEPDWLSDTSKAALAEVHDPWPWMRRDVPRWWAYHSYLLSDHVEGSGLGEHIWERGTPFGLRSGAPLFDVGLVELVLRIPPWAHWQRLDRSLARATVAGRLPDEVRTNRRKANIGPFYLDVMTGPDSAILRELLLDPRARVREFADPGWIDQNVARARAREDPDWLMWTTVVWRLAMAECWLRWLEDERFPGELLARGDLPELVATPV